MGTLIGACLVALAMLNLWQRSTCLRIAEMEPFQNSNLTMDVGKHMLIPIGNMAKPVDRRCTFQNEIIAPTYPDFWGLHSRGGNDTFGTFTFHGGFISIDEQGNPVESLVEVTGMQEAFGEFQCQEFTIGTLDVKFKEGGAVSYWDLPEDINYFIFFGRAADEETFKNRAFEPTDCCEELFTDSISGIFKCKVNFGIKWDPFGQVQAWGKGGEPRISMWGCGTIRVQVRHEITSSESKGECNFITSEGTGIGKGFIKETRPATLVEGAGVIITSELGQYVPVSVSVNAKVSEEPNDVGFILLAGMLYATIMSSKAYKLAEWDRDRVVQIHKDLQNLENEINGRLATIRNAINTDRANERRIETVALGNTLGIHALMIKEKMRELSSNSTGACALLKSQGVKINTETRSKCQFQYPYETFVEMLIGLDTSNLTLPNVTVNGDEGWTPPADEGWGWSFGWSTSSFIIVCIVAVIVGIIVLKMIMK